jgi:hypothetical protein
MLTQMHDTYNTFLEQCSHDLRTFNDTSNVPFASIVFATAMAHGILENNFCHQKQEGQWNKFTTWSVE